MLKKLVLPLIFTAAASANIELPPHGPSEGLWPQPEAEKTSYVIEPKTGAEFIDYLQPDQKAALVIFCTPLEPVCREPALEDALEMVAKNRRAQINVIKINPEDVRFSALARYFRVNTVPHVLLFQGGIGLGRTYGVLSGTELRDWVDQKLTPQPQPQEKQKNAP